MLLLLTACGGASQRDPAADAEAQARAEGMALRNAIEAELQVTMAQARADALANEIAARDAADAMAADEWLNTIGTGTRAGSDDGAPDARSDAPASGEPAQPAASDLQAANDAVAAAMAGRRRDRIGNER